MIAHLSDYRRRCRMTDDCELSLWRNDKGYLVIDTGAEIVSHHRLLATARLDPDELAGQDVHHRTGVKIDTLDNLDAVDREEHNRLHTDEDRLPDPKDVF